MRGRMTDDAELHGGSGAVVRHVQLVESVPDLSVVDLALADLRAHRSCDRPRLRASARPSTLTHERPAAGVERGQDPEVAGSPIHLALDEIGERCEVRSSQRRQAALRSSSRTALCASDEE